MEQWREFGQRLPAEASLDAIMRAAHDRGSTTLIAQGDDRELFERVHRLLLESHFEAMLVDESSFLDEVRDRFRWRRSASHWQSVVARKIEASKAAGEEP